MVRGHTNPIHATSIRITGSKVKRAVWLTTALGLSFVLGTADAKAAFELNPCGPRASSMGGAGVAMSGDAGCIFRNPALIAWGKPAVEFTWSQAFGLPELTREALCAGFAIRHQSVSLRAGRLGNELYRESEFGLGASRAILPEVALGFEVVGRWLGIRGYSLGRALALSAGIAARPVSGLELGAVWNNFNSPKLSGFVDRLPESLSFGLAAAIGRNGRIVADVVEEKSFPAEYRVGAELRAIPELCLRVGGRAEPVRPSAGFQVDIRHWAFSYAGDFHPDLGVSHEVGLEYRFGQ